MIILILIISLVCLYCVYNIFINNRVIFKKRIIIDNDTLAYIDHYFMSFNKTDRRVRNNLTKQKYLSSLRYPTKREIENLGDKTSRVDTLYPKLAKNVPWLFIIFSGNIEKKYTHTHGRYIFIHEEHIESISSTTLLHEKIHVYQRMFPCETMLLFLSLGYSINGIRDNSGRSNPDINDIEYLDDKKQKINNIYKTTAITIDDIVDTRDHPNEIMAYEISRGNISYTTLAWIGKYFI